MRRSTVIRHLAELAHAATRGAELPGAAQDRPPLRELWVGGDLLEEVDDIDHVVAILVFDLPAEDLPEIALHDAERALSLSLGIGKRPMIWRSRPASRPAWSHLERRVARCWSTEAGTDVENLEGLGTPSLTGARIVEPTDEELRGWLAQELPRSEAHLRVVLEEYWTGSWRRQHTSGGIHPDDHLWRAAWAVQSMRDALADLS